MRKIILTMHVTLDGFVAGPNGEMDWIQIDDAIFDYAGKMTDEADTALYGRVTWQMMDSYWPTAGDQPTASKHDIEHSRWYNGVAKVIISKTMQGSHLSNTKVISDHIEEEIKKLKAQAGKNIQIFGSPSASHALMQYNLIDEYWLFVNPVLLGQGIPLFGNITDKISLKLVESKAFESGVMVLHYVINSDQRPASISFSTT
jgi:dihydrofolate reductase